MFLVTSGLRPCDDLLLSGLQALTQRIFSKIQSNQKTHLQMQPKRKEYNPRRMQVNEFLSQSSLFPGLRAERLWSRSGETKRVECPLLLSGLQALTQLFRFRSLIKNEKSEFRFFRFRFRSLIKNEKKSSLKI